jgi:hypothetical protein
LLGYYSHFFDFLQPFGGKMFFRVCCKFGCSRLGLGQMVEIWEGMLMGNRKIYFMVLIFLLLLLLGCGLPGVGEEAPAQLEPESPLPTEIPPARRLPTPEPTAVPSWRMPAPAGSLLVVQDTDNDPAWEEIAATQAAALAIPAPYYYEVYLLPAGIKFPEVEAHYEAEMSARKYTPARNEQGDNQMYLMTYLYPLNRTSKNAVLFYAELSNREPMVLVIYSHPIE